MREVSDDLTVEECLAVEDRINPLNWLISIYRFFISYRDTK
jgi:hypothetical protein